MHESLHALGFLHEQSRPDRDDFVRINFINITPGVNLLFWTFSLSLILNIFVKKENADQFVKYSTDANTFNLAYDYKSIMHYPSTAFAKNPEMPTIEPLKKHIKLIGAHEKTHLSHHDIIAIRKLYDC